MKKKHRDIVVDGVTYGWIANYSNVRIFENKVVIGSYTIPERLDITPKIVAALIEDPVLALQWINAEPCPYCGGGLKPHPHKVWQNQYFACFHTDKCWLNKGIETFTLVPKSQIDLWNTRY